MLCHVDVQDASTIVADDEKAVEHSEGDRWHGEEVHGCNRFPVVSKEGEPTFARVRISRRSFHPTGDGSLRNIKTEHEKLAMDPGCASRGVLNDHAEDQLPNLLRRPSSSNLRPNPGKQPPIHTKTSYDNLSRLLSVLHQAGGRTIDGASYTLDAAGNRTSKSDWQAGVTSKYSYDPIYELTQAVQGLNTTESYDPVGNRLSSLGVSPYQYNASNELTQTPNALYAQDANGNTTIKTDTTGSTTYTWDYENRLMSVTLPGTAGTATFKYDPFGRRIYKQSPNATSIFVYDGDSLIETVNATGGVVARYTQGQNIDEPLAMQRGTITDYYEADGLGSITSLTDPTGAVARGHSGSKLRR
jgi:YD repeat-containing protein